MVRFYTLHHIGSIVPYIDVCKDIHRSFRNICTYVLLHQQSNLPGAVGDLNTDPMTLLPTTLRGWVIAGSRPTQTRPCTASVVVATSGPAGPGTKASIDCNITNLAATEKVKNKTPESNGRKVLLCEIQPMGGCKQKSIFL